MTILAHFTHTDWFHLSFLLILYAETHYRFKYFFSYLKKNEPEIIADIPSRITLSTPIPVLLIVKDADKFPVLIKEVSVYEKKRFIYSQEVNKKVNATYEDISFFINSNNLSQGQHQFDIKISYIINNKNKNCYADNYRGTSHDSLPIFISQDPLPTFGNCIFGDTHIHTYYTSDQVEFGASLEATRLMSRAIGLGFFCATDHSYDLDDHENNYLENDPELKKWKSFKNEVKNINSNPGDVIVIPGEEVSVRNSEDKNVHLLIYNSDRFFPGAGDSGEKWFRNLSDLSISEVISELDNSSLVISAHPSETPPFLQRLLINRGSWKYRDCIKSGLNGLQFINGGGHSSIEKSKNFWINLLLQGNRLTGIAGNDAHGNFSRFRQIGFPFITMKEHYLHLFGKWRTGIYLKNNKCDLEAILNAFKSGNCFMTNGPAILLEVFTANGHYSMGEKCKAPVKCKIKVRSTVEFGSLNSIKIIRGDLNKKQEIIYYEINHENDVFDFHKEIFINNIPDRGYFRVEAITVNQCQALSNPIWFG